MQTKFDLIQKKIDLYDLSKQNDQNIAETLKKDLENLSYIMKNNGLKYDDGDDSILMVSSIFGNEIF